jgi:hypothetical protein
MMLHGSSKGGNSEVLLFVRRAGWVLAGSKECACSVLESATVVCSRSEQVSKAEASEIVVEGCDVVGRLSSPSCVTRLCLREDPGMAFVVQPAGDLLTRKASKGLLGQLPRGGPRPESVLRSLIRSLIFSFCVCRVTLFGVSGRGGGGSVSGLLQVDDNSLLFDDIHCGIDTKREACV